MLHDFCQSEKMNRSRNEVCNPSSSKEPYHLHVAQVPESDAISDVFNRINLECILDLQHTWSLIAAVLPAACARHAYGPLDVKQNPYL